MIKHVDVRACVCVLCIMTNKKYDDKRIETWPTVESAHSSKRVRILL